MQDFKLKEILTKDNAKIRWINYGTANCFSYDWKGNKTKIIEINKQILDYPLLFQQVVLHEIRHSKEPWTKEDLINDIKPTINKAQFMQFMFKNPTTWIDGLPLYKTKKRGWVFDINLLILWIVGLAIALFLKIYL